MSMQPGHTTDIQQLIDTGQTEQAFSLVMSRYNERLYWHIRRMVITHEDANDVLQEVLIKVWKNLSKFEGRSQLYTWLNRIATNECLTFLKKRNRTYMVALDSGENASGNQLKADVYFDGNEAEKALQLALLTLPDKQRLVFNMKYFDEMRYREISEILGTSVGALKASYHLAAKKIEVFLKEYLN